jgi:hypothetical protein
VRTREVLREAWRNAASGTARPILAAVVFVLVVGAVGFAQARGVVDVAIEAQRWRDAGASVEVVALTGQIDGRQCDALTGAPGVAAAGAVRKAASFSVASLPSSPLQVFEATPGLAGVLHASPFSERGAGVWLAADLAADLGVSAERPDVTRTDGQRVDVAGTFAYPSDRRLPTLAYSAVSPVAATGLFDACWVELWPETDSARTLLTLPVVGTMASDGQLETPQVQQLNPGLGSAFDAANRLAAVPIWPLTGAAVVAAAGLALALIRIRRLELASARHAGVDSVSLTSQAAVESMVWLLPALALLWPFLWWSSTWANPDQPWSALFPTARTAILAGLAVVLTTSAATALTRERHLFQHFKRR